MKQHELPPYLRNDERKAISLRRQKAHVAGHLKKTDIDAQEIKGLALSGGGIRSAFIARGLIEELHTRKFFAKFDYISSVSGGGYTAAGVISQLCHRPADPLFNSDYRLEAPPYKLGRLITAFVLDLLFHCLPLFALIALPLFTLVRGNAEDSQNVSIVGGLTAFGALALGEVSRRRRISQRPPLTAELFVLTTFLCFFLGALAAIEYGAWQSSATILLCMFLRERYVSANPHRFQRTSDPLFRWSFATLLGVLSTTLVLIVHMHTWAEIALWVVAFIGLLFPWNWSLKWQNKVHFVFQSYRQILLDRFLPQDTTPVKLHNLPQSWNPYPIFNASANLGSSLIEFELTPHYCGSFKTGYAKLSEHLPDLDLADAMAISGGAVDFIKSTATLSALGGALFGGTGYWVAAQTSGQLQYVLTSLNRLLTLAGARPTTMQLSDGGFVENLGALALFKRRSDVIVCLDAGFDPEFEFEDLRQLCVTLRSEDLATLVIPDLASASTKFRFQQNTSGILTGNIVYPGGAAGALKYGKYIHVKINGSQHSLAGKFKGFPHITTLDQQLSTDEIMALYRLGRELALELAYEPEFTAKFS
ncbi:Patatin-like phospholipase [Duganella sp. CF402]|uniref:patatin-like phospholipase family protein n=1 Tax=unclassified Duganella TaxID=2636909 RepID=UPI0008BD3851|nr:MULTISPECIES: patatin-like phospholipase family protein [unclassified Duganella]RZT10466.1 patatin-like phospholipase [Duganella sp. BK701]SEL11943.1 Patatin-like phospholipase [Duganella sp. CF402]